MKTTAVKAGNEYVLNGAKIFITNGGIADYYIVFAVTDRDASSRNTTAFIVEKETQGFSIGKKKANWASAHRQRQKSSLKTVVYPKGTGLVKKAKVLR